tara:strand:- start:60 stop:341 length:282 start_codon:yes stop_codon:yes gene_type:complete
MKAVWNGKVIAESEDTEVVEGNHYFPEQSIKKKYFKESAQQSVCPWKGTASYYSIEVDGETNQNAAWYYPEPKEKASQIKNFVAFWKGVKIEK